jgi:DNA invertase Pin-like site-specific DNA recombinase
MGGKRKVNAGQSGRGTRQTPVYDSYARLSRVPETGELEKIEIQLADNRKVIERQGGVLGEELSDGMSAWKRGVRRPGWERLLERVESGESDGIVVWHTDRLFRQPRDLEELVELGERGFRLASAHGERDLASPEDQFMLRIEVAHAKKSSDDTSRRIKRRFQTKREQGAGYLGGPRRFGWPGKDATWMRGPEKKEEDRPVVSAELVERERSALRSGTDDLLTGKGLGTVADSWNEAGVRTAAGREWIAVTVKSVLLRPLNAGLIEHEGKLVARMPGDPIVDPKTFERLRAMFAARRRGRVHSDKHVGSGIVRCGLCGTKLSVSTTKEVYRGSDERRTQYFCNRQRRGCGKVYADKRAVNEELKLITIARLSDSRYAQAISAARAQVAERLAEVRKEIAECEEIQRGLSERLGRREMNFEAFDQANLPLVRDLARLREELESLSGGNLAGPTTAQSPEEIARQWDDGGNTEKRGLLKDAVGSRLAVAVLPAPEGGKRVFSRDRVKVMSVKELQALAPPQVGRPVGSRAS